MYTGMQARMYMHIPCHLTYTYTGSSVSTYTYVGACTYRMHFLFSKARMFFFVFLFFVFICLFFGFWFFETGFLCVALTVLELTLDQAGLKLRNSPASASQVLRLKVCASTPGIMPHFYEIVKQYNNT